MLRGDTVTRDLLAELIRGAVDDMVKRQLQRRAQEPAITSKIATALEARLNGYSINGYHVSVVAQDFPDRGPRSWEQKSGADLYIGIRVQSPFTLEPIAKGMLVQSKKVDMVREMKTNQDRLQISKTRSQRDLISQCEKMVGRSDKGSFVWVYGPDGTHIVPASEVLNWEDVRPELLAGRGVGDQFRDVLDCFSGDPQLVAKGIFDSDRALGAYLEEIAVQRGVTINLGTDLG